MGIAENLLKLRTAKGLSQGDLAKLSGVSQQLISQLENSKNTSTKHLPKLARALDATVYEIDENYWPEEGTAPMGAPLISWVSAGALIVPDTISSFEEAPRISAPGLDPNGDWIALRVEGDSMDRISPPDSIIFVNLKERRPVLNACFVIVSDEGEASYKRFRDGVWSPVSTNKKHKPVEPKDGQSLRVVGRVRKSVLSL